MKSHWRYSIIVVAASLALVAALGACAASSGSAATQSQSPTTSAPPAAPSQPPPQGNPGGRFGGGASGTIASINGSTLTLSTQQGDVTVNVDANAVIQKTVGGSLSDLQTGQFVTVIGTADASGNVAATSISLRGVETPRFTPQPGATPNQGGSGRFSGTPAPRTPNGTSGNGVFGTISAANGNTLTITTVQSQQVTVTVGSSTRISKTVSGTLSDLQVGEPVTVGGAPDSYGTIQATFITIPPDASAGGS